MIGLRWGLLVRALALTAAFAACDLPAIDRPLYLVSFPQQGSASVALNEDLQFYFSEELDRASVTSDSLRVLDDLGRDVPGERSVRGKALTFSPVLPRAPDLSDGALRPGSAYRVVLGGFPRLDGIRARSGALLSATLVLEFRTTAADGTGPLFLDPYLSPGPLVPRGSLGSLEVVLRDGRLVLECRSPLDPSSVDAQDFTLHRVVAPGDPQVIPLAVELALNTRDRAELWLEPLDRPTLEPARHYVLRMTGRHLRTLGGRPVEPGWSYLQLRVPDPLESRFELDAARDRPAVIEVPEGCDGTASWDEHGVGVLFPAAAGLGEDGRLTLTRAPAQADVQATRLLIPAGNEVDLSPRSGPLVLRSQSALEIRGTLRRRAAYGEREHASDPVSLFMRRAASDPAGRLDQTGDPPRDLDGWLQWLLQPDQPWSQEPWTVIVAGGDIVVPRGGSLEVEGPLVLVAGGWIRVSGALRGYELWKTPRTVGNVAGRPAGRTGASNTLDLPLEVPGPAQNPLREDLRLGLLTGPLRLPPGPTGWRTVIERSGSGQVAVEFLVQRRVGGVVRELRVKDAGRIGTSEFRILVELQVPAAPGGAGAPPWDPPRLERLVLEPFALDR